MKAVPDMIEKWVPGKYVSLGTDGFGRSDTRESLRKFFEMDADHIAAAAISTLLSESKITQTKAEKALRTLEINPNAKDPSRD
jgi:pyruvate dehydrogenase E1 component